jgi:hypothetical protein
MKFKVRTLDMIEYLTLKPLPRVLSRLLLIAMGASARFPFAMGGELAASTTAPAEPQMAVYRWVLRPDNVEAFGRWIGHPDVWAEDFTDNSSWDNIENPGWLLKPWGKWVMQRPGRRLILGVPLLPGPWDGSGPIAGSIDLKIPVSLEKGAAGDYDRHFAALAKNLVAQGLGETILRPGWEFNGGWYTWRGAGKADALAAYWRHIVRAMRAVPGAAGLRFCFNPSVGYQGFPAEQAWPGDEFVDYVGVDVYDDAWVKDTYPWPADATQSEIAARQKKVWDTIHYGGDHGLKFWARFAADHHKPLALPEWGIDDRPEHHGGMDDPYFIEQMHAFITDPKNNVAFQCYFDVEAPDGHHQLSPGLKGDEKTEFPRAAAKFRELFGR